MVCLQELIVCMTVILIGQTKSEMHSSLCFIPFNFHNDGRRKEMYIIRSFPRLAEEGCPILLVRYRFVFRKMIIFMGSLLIILKLQPH